MPTGSFACCSNMCSGEDSADFMQLSMLLRCVERRVLVLATLGFGPAPSRSTAVVDLQSVGLKWRSFFRYPARAHLAGINGTAKTRARAGCTCVSMRLAQDRGLHTST